MDGLRRVLIVLALLVSARAVLADEPIGLPLPQPAAASVSPIQDDAGLYDVKFVGSQAGWAVGDHGVVWHSEDGGKSWQLLPTPVDCTLRSICFLSDRVGWIVGGGVEPHTRQGFGVLLATKDGGKTWKQYGKETLPPLFYVRFFGLKQGVAVGEASTDHPTGVLTTGDGGETWQSMVGKEHRGWRTADFISDGIGIVAGLRGSTSLVADRQLLPTRMPDLGIRAFADVKLLPDQTGWLVGDGGLVLRTDNAGLVWQDPPTPLPLELNDVIDFRTVAARGAKAWIAGAPGSAVWHTEDGGRSWKPQATGQTVPIHAIAFADDSHGWAVGALGVVLRTENGGRDWQAVRGEQRRVALMAIHARANRVSFHLTAQASGEEGYRSLTLLPARYDIGPDGQDEQEQDLRLHDAVVAAGGATGIVGWQLPVAVPDLEKNREELMADWRRRTDRELTDSLLGSLVCNLRTWRPSVVVIDQPPADDAVGSLFQEAVLAAVAQANDETRFIRQRQFAFLAPWQVQKVFARLPRGSQGQTGIDPNEYMPRLGRTLREAAAPAQCRVTTLSRESAGIESYRLVGDYSGLPSSKTSRQDFFSGLAISPGSDARRRLAPFDENDDDRRRKIAAKQRTFNGYAEKYLDDPARAGQLIAQLSYVTSGMSSGQGALQLMQLAGEYRQRSQWDLFEATLMDLVERYPDEPTALEAMQQLLHLWSGAEPSWQRTRQLGANRQSLHLDTDLLSKRIQKAVDAARKGKGDEYMSEVELGLGPDPLQVVDKPAELKAGNSQQWQLGVMQHWNRQALRMAKLIRKKSPRAFHTPEVQFAVAAAMRFVGGPRLADDFYHHWLRTPAQSPWTDTANAELWLGMPNGGSPKKIVTCHVASSPPYLDEEFLSDACWREAEEIPLTRTAGKKSKNSDAEPRAVAWLAYDSRYLYFAASVPRDAKAPPDLPQMEGRAHDADLSGFDRVGLYLDLDRDYTTFYSLQVDQRGWTSESCWEDRSWNPSWHVAAQGDEKRWQIEAAIPFEALAPSAPARHDVWALGVIRTIPAVGLQSWTHPAANNPRPETFGLLHFD